MKKSCTPFDRVTVPVKSWPAPPLGFILVVEGNMISVVVSPGPGAAMLHVPDREYTVVNPPQVMETLATDVASVPVLVSVM